MNFISKNKYIILVITLLTCLMFYFIGEKQGFHEDEIFSIGSSNYKYDNVYRPFGYAEATQDVFYNQVLKSDHKLYNLKKFIFDNNSFIKDENLVKEVPIFKTKDDAIEYLTIGKGDIFNYFSVYYNQSRDVHPPLFYFLIHFVSTIFYGTFSKYIIFSINLLFFIGTLLVINKIMKRLNKEKLGIPTMILYGGSIGCISTVMFQRMYMMLTFFSILYLYLTIKFIQDDFIINKKKLWILTILCGFLTQYYFCIYIVLVFILISIYLIIKKQYKKLYNYFIIHFIPAIIGIVFYPASIYHIFFSYRGIGDGGSTKIIIENVIYYLSQIYKLFGFKNLLLITILVCIILIIKNKIKINKEKVNYLILLLVPVIMYILIVSKIAPFLGEDYTSRYIMLTFPIIAISIMYLFSLITKSSIIPLIISVVLVINGLFNETPVYLYKDYKKVMDLAQENKEDYFVYVFDNNFTHLSSLPEFATYKASLIINVNEYDFSLLNNSELNSSNEFIVCIKKWLNQDEILNKILKNTKFNDYEKLLELDSDVESIYYKFS